jgi:hypothetical protein
MCAIPEIIMWDVRCERLECGIKKAPRSPGYMVQAARESVSASDAVVYHE